jgi:hypothetical protein
MVPSNAPQPGAVEDWGQSCRLGGPFSLCQFPAVAPDGQGCVPTKHFQKQAESGGSGQAMAQGLRGTPVLG